MKYLVNFQVEITLKEGRKDKVRSTFTIIEKDIEKIPENDFDMIKNWFIKYFHENDLEEFIDVSKINKEYNVKIKVGRITNSIDGKYKTF
tara:strand:+ start:289 stop:558 length:270 start_codon:yes stop_codon:yes gene_type:complete